MQTPVDIPSAVLLMREHGITRLRIGDVEIEVGPAPPLPGQTAKLREPKNPMSVLARGTRLQLRQTEANAEDASDHGDQTR